MELVEELMIFGLTRTEASIYLTLFAEGDLNGYEVSKITGISKSNTYNALAGLVEKGAAYIIEGNSISYIPVDIEEFCGNKIRLMQDLEKKLKKSVPKRKEESDGYITIKSEKHIIDKMRNMLLNAKERVYISMDEELLSKVKDELIELINKNIKVVIISNDDVNLDEAIFYKGEKQPRQIRLIVDSKFVLTGEIGNRIDSTCLYSSNNNLVKVFKEALTNEIKLIQIRKDDMKDD